MKVINDVSHVRPGDRAIKNRVRDFIQCEYTMHAQINAIHDVLSVLIQAVDLDALPITDAETLEKYQRMVQTIKTRREAGRLAVDSGIPFKDFSRSKPA